MSNSLWVGTRKGLFRIVRNSNGAWDIKNTWFLGDPVSMLLPEPTHHRVLVALDLGHFGIKLKHSDNNGETWVDAPVPTFPPKPDHLVDKDPMRGVDIPWNTQLVWSLEASLSGDLWCGVIPGGLFYSDNGGDTWNFMRSLWDDPRRQKWVGGGYDFAGIHSILIDPRDSHHVTVGVSVGGVWKTRDKGTTWELVGSGLRNEYMPPEMADDPITQDAHRIVQCSASPDHLWMQHHNGIFMSQDCGLTWEELTQVQPSSFGFAVAVHPKDPQIAWFVPATKDEQRYPVDAQLVVTRTMDGGKSFEVLHQGLPEEPSYDLVYRHALDVDNTGDQLAFGSTTGSLWVSENQGVNWQSVSKHLPPVLCVRFGD